MKWFVFAATVLILGPSAQAEAGSNSAVKTDDICAEHPDLCGDEERAVEKPKKRASTTQGRCRKKGESYSLDDASLPLCATTAKNAKKNTKKKRGKDSFDDLLEELDEGEETADRQPAAENRRPTRRISFTSYLNSNANHPSIAGRFGGRQEAFIVAPRTGTLTAPSSVSVPVGDSNADGQSMRDFPVTPPSGSSSSSNNRNQ